MNRLKLAGWSFIPLAVIVGGIGFVAQERAGGMDRSPEARVAAGLFLACVGAAGILLTADSHRRGVVEEETQTLVRKDKPVQFYASMAGGYFFWGLFLAVGLYTAIRAWTG